MAARKKHCRLSVFVQERENLFYVSAAGMESIQEAKNPLMLR
jgi:hypothetical protein